jgi:hypothetical protein
MPPSDVIFAGPCSASPGGKANPPGEVPGSKDPRRLKTGAGDL